MTGAILASTRTPIGAAASFEPRPGLDMDWAVLGPGRVVPPLLVALGTVGNAWVATRKAPDRPARSAVTVVGPAGDDSSHRFVQRQFALDDSLNLACWIGRVHGD